MPPGLSASVEYGLPPYKVVMARQGKTVFGDPPPTKTPACLSDDLNPAATRCKHCGADISAPPLHPCAGDFEGEPKGIRNLCL